MLTELQKQWLNDMRTGAKWAIVTGRDMLDDKGRNELHNDEIIYDYAQLGLAGISGTLKVPVNMVGATYNRLADMKGIISFPEIADYIEAHPENVFTDVG